MEDKNIIIAKQLVKIAKELVASEEKVAASSDFFQDVCFKPFGLEYVETSDFNEFDKLFDGVENSLCCVTSSGMPEDKARRYFELYGGDFVVILKDKKPVAVLHEDSHQLKSLDDNNVNDENVRKAVARYLYHKCKDFNKFKAECVGNLQGLDKLIEEGKDGVE